MARENDRNGEGIGHAGSPPGSTGRDWLIVRQAQCEGERVRYRRLEARWSWIRLFVFVVGVSTVVLLWDDLLLAAAVGGIGLVAFAAAVVRHADCEDRRAFTERMLVVVKESLCANEQRDHPVRAWQRPEDPPGARTSLPTIIGPGPGWSLSDQERDDLDLYGPPVGIFGLLNRTSTDLGARRLRDMLDSPCLSCEHIQQRQQAVRWLDAHNEQRLHVMAAATVLRGRSGFLDQLVELLHHVEPAPRSIVSTGIRIWSIFSGSLAVYAIARISVGSYAWVRLLVAVLVLNSLLLFIHRRTLSQLRAAVATWAGLPHTLKRLLLVVEHAHRELPDDTQLRVLKDHFGAVIAHGRIPSLCAWLEWAGLHGAVRSVLNILIFLDLHVEEAVLARVVPSRDLLLRGLSATAELEALCSLASFSAELPTACYPQPAAQTSLVIDDGRHPLILERDSTPNSIRLTADTRTWVITGPNAAGKSTFLRMVGVNAVLAQIGAAVPAGEMTWSPVRLMTDVRIRDSLARNESYFLSEVRRLRRMVLDSQDSTPILGLIDEPFRGTNSQERIAASIALLEYLTASSHLFLVATHEEMLAQVAARTASAENYHFQEHLHDGGITFDYRLRSGPATTKTALRILEREGYPDSLLDRARRLMTGGTQTAQPD
jgi:hypothetical protein